MSFWLKVRQAIRAGDELIPETHLPEIGGDKNVVVTKPDTPVTDYTVVPEPVVFPVPEPVILPPTEVEDPQDTPEQATKDAARYIDQVRPFYTLVGRTEGTDKGRGYDETLGYGAFDPPNYPQITAQTLAELDRFQTLMLGHKKNKLNSSAVGRYQYIRTTLRALKRKWGIIDLTYFSPSLQDDLCYITLVGRGLVRWRKGQITDNQFIDALSAEWASLPNSKGKGTYKGQHTGCSLDELRAVLAQIK